MPRIAGHRRRTTVPSTPALTSRSWHEPSAHEIESRRGMYEVYAGDPVPGLGRVDAIRRQERERPGPGRDIHHA